MRCLKSFFKEENGAVAVDWFVMCAALVGLAVLAAVNVGAGVFGLSTTVSEEIEDKDV
ncbi:MAG: hypothetical protein AAFY35_06880 [Pseudomonadota bacterium]